MKMNMMKNIKKLLYNKNLHLIFGIVIGYFIVTRYWLNEGYMNCQAGRCLNKMGKNGCNCGCNSNEGYYPITKDDDYTMYDDIQTGIPSGLNWKQFYEMDPQLNNMHRHTNLVLPCDL